MTLPLPDHPSLTIGAALLLADGTGAALAEGTPSPALAGVCTTVQAGAQFQHERTLGGFFRYVDQNMSTDWPSMPMPAQTAGIVGLILEANDYPAGETELPTDVAALGAITFGPQPSAAP